MAVPGESSALTVTVTYGNEKHSLQVASQEEDSQPTVRDMALLIEQVTGVPVSFQKLIHKGKSLKEMNQPLSTFGVKNGCKVMLIGKRVTLIVMNGIEWYNRLSLISAVYMVESPDMIPFGTR
ncbi:BAG family molecular chaperone regulator 1 [Varanus komodoensis]|nr:BAG family molecular chaperone regulator 1 [Varanus komodoensis]